MTKEVLYFRLRIPEELKRRISASSRFNQRSMNAEIIARLEASYALGDAPAIDLTDEELVDVLSDVERLKLKLIKLRKQKLR